MTAAVLLSEPQLPCCRTHHKPIKACSRASSPNLPRHNQIKPAPSTDHLHNHTQAPDTVAHTWLKQANLKSNPVYLSCLNTSLTRDLRVSRMSAISSDVFHWRLHTSSIQELYQESISHLNEAILKGKKYRRWQGNWASRYCMYYKIPRAHTWPEDMYNRRKKSEGSVSKDIRRRGM